MIDGLQFLLREMLRIAVKGVGLMRVKVKVKMKIKMKMKMRELGFIMGVKGTFFIIFYRECYCFLII